MEAYIELNTRHDGHGHGRETVRLSLWNLYSIKKTRCFAQFKKVSTLSSSPYRGEKVRPKTWKIAGETESCPLT